MCSIDLRDFLSLPVLSGSKLKEEESSLSVTSVIANVGGRDLLPDFDPARFLRGESNMPRSGRREAGSFLAPNTLLQLQPHDWWHVSGKEGTSYLTPSRLRCVRVQVFDDLSLSPS